jgi:hypothetical protein
LFNNSTKEKKMALLFSRGGSKSQSIPTVIVTETRTKEVVAIPPSITLTNEKKKEVVPAVLKIFSAAKPTKPITVPIPLREMLAEAVAPAQPSQTNEKMCLGSFVRIKDEYRVGEENLLGKIVYYPENSLFTRVQWEMAGSFGVYPDILIDYRAKDVLEVVPTPTRYKPFGGKKQPKEKVSGSESKPKIKLNKNKKEDKKK